MKDNKSLADNILIWFESIDLIIPYITMHNKNLFIQIDYLNFPKKVIIIKICTLK